MAAHWTPGDLPALRVVIALYAAVLTGRYAQAGELRLAKFNTIPLINVIALTFEIQHQAN